MKYLQDKLNLLLAKNATDKELNDFLEEVAFNDDITNDEYMELQKKAQSIRKI